MTPARALAGLLFALLLPVSGCARLLQHYDVTPTGLARADARLRQAIAADADTARLRSLIADPDALPSDPLLARLYTGILAYHAGQYARSAAVLDTATLAIDARMTRSASRTAASLISSDRVLPWQPGASERLMLHYYAAFAWLRSGSVEDATVEARRLSLLLERTPPADGAQRALHAALRHFAAAIFARAGDYNDADVAYRNALLLAGDSAQNVQMPAPTTDSVDVLVFVDRGFVGHLAEQSIALWLGADELRGLRSGDAEGQWHVAQLVAARVTAASGSGGDSGTLFVDLATEDTTSSAVANGSAPDHGTRAPATGTTSAAPASIFTSAGAASAQAQAHEEHADDDDDEEDDSSPYLMRVAWPVFRDVARVGGTATLVSEGVTHAPLAHASVSDAVARDFAGERGWMLARTVARAAAKLALTRGIEDEIREKDDTAADIFSILGNVTAAVTEQADTRSWTLLPARIEVLRARVPVGTRQVVVEAGGRQVFVPIDAQGGVVVLRHITLQ